MKNQLIRCFVLVMFISMTKVIMFKAFALDPSLVVVDADETDVAKLSSEEVTRLKNIGTGWYKVKPSTEDVSLVHRALQGDDVTASDMACLAIEKMAKKGLFDETNANKVMPHLISRIISKRDDTSTFSMRAIGAIAGEAKLLGGEYLVTTTDIVLELLTADNPEVRRRAVCLAAEIVHLQTEKQADQLLRKILKAVKRPIARYNEEVVKPYMKGYEYPELNTRLCAVLNLSYICKHITDRELAIEVTNTFVNWLDSPSAEDVSIRIQVMSNIASLAHKVDGRTRDRLIVSVITAAADQRYSYSITSGLYTPPLHAGANALASVAKFLDADTLEKAKQAIPKQNTVEKEEEYESMYRHVLQVLAAREEQLKNVDAKHPTKR